MVANWRTQVYVALVRLSKDDGSPGRADGPGVWGSSDPNVTVTPLPDPDPSSRSARVEATADAAATITWDGDGDLGAGTLPLHAEALAVFSEIDIEATGVAMSLGEPVDKT